MTGACVFARLTNLQCTNRLVWSPSIGYALYGYVSWDGGDTRDALAPIVKPYDLTSLDTRVNVQVGLCNGAQVS